LFKSKVGADKALGAEISHHRNTCPPFHIGIGLIIGKIGKEYDKIEKKDKFLVWYLKCF